MRPYNSIVHPRGWRAFMEYGNGIMGDMCIHMYDMARWMLELGWPRRISSSGGILMSKGTQGQHRRHPDGHFRFRRPGHRLAASHLGRRTRPQVSVGRDLLRREGHVEGQRDGLRLHPARRRQADPPRGEIRVRRVSRRQDRERPRTPRGAGHPRAHERSSSRRSPREVARSPTSRKVISPRRAASSPTWRCSLDARSPGTPKPAASLATTRPTAC